MEDQAQVQPNLKDVRNLTPQEEVRHDGRGHQLCNARKNTCKGWAMLPSTKCRRCGGATPRGIASPHYKGKGRSKYLAALPDRLIPGYLAALKNKDLLTNGDEIALLDTRIQDVLKQADLGETDTIWASLKEAWGEFESAMSDKDLERAQLAVPNISRLIKKGGEDWQVWEQIGKLLEQRRKLVESESRRLLQQQETLTSSEAYLLFNSLLSVVQEHVLDREVRAKIQNGFLRHVSSNGEARRLVS